MLKLGWTCCPFCHRQDIYVSHPKHLWEEFAILVLLQPVRCHDCMRRFLRPLFATPPANIAVRRVAPRELAEKDADVTDKRRAA